MNFKRYVESSDTWVDTPHYIHNTATDTITTLPAVLYPNAVTATVGLKGNMQQTGTPTPTTPIQPQECGERTGNLVHFYQEEMRGNFYGVDVTVKNAEITLNGTVTPGSGHWVEIGYKFGEGTASTDNVVIPCEPETPYTIAIEILDGNSSQVRLIAFGTSIENRTVSIGSSSTTTFSDDINRIFISLGAGGVVFNNLKFRVMFNKGSAQLPYEPYGIKTSISSNSTTTNVYLGEVQTTRQIKKLVLTGGEDENWNITNNSKVLYLAVSDFLKEQGTICYCTHYETVNNVSSADDVNDGECAFNDHIDWLYIKDNNYTSAQGFKNYLAAQYAAGTPVTVWYVLATAETGIVNEPIRKIGTYADEVSGITIPTIAGVNTLSIGTTLQPSEVNVNYKGWHPVQSVHERENGAWT